MPKKKNLTLAPIKLDTHTWFYIEPRGLHAYRDVHTSDGTYAKTDDFVIPWRTIVLGLGRYRSHVRGKRRKRPTLPKQGGSG